jgi:hypothetical protein
VALRTPLRIDQRDLVSARFPFGRMTDSRYALSPTCRLKGLKINRHLRAHRFSERDTRVNETAQSVVQMIPPEDSLRFTAADSKRADRHVIIMVVIALVELLEKREERNSACR